MIFINYSKNLKMLMKLIFWLDAIKFIKFYNTLIGLKLFIMKKI